jgi:hypothetical protein
MHASPAFHGHAWICAARRKRFDATRGLLLTIRINKEGTRTHDIFGPPTL